MSILRAAVVSGSLVSYMMSLCGGKLETLLEVTLRRDDASDQMTCTASLGEPPPNVCWVPC